MTDADVTQIAGPVPGVRLGEEIGRGGFARVYRGHQLAVDREVAVKIDSRPLDDERNRRRFLREASAAGRISGHPHVVSLIDVGTTRDNLPYLVMELCPGGSVSDLLRSSGPLRVDEARDLGLAIAGALAAAHEAGILHRDVKPANILIDAYGTPRLADFGLAALPATDRELSVTLEALTPAYASPESFAATDPTTRSDVWSMGATLHALISTASPRRTPDGSAPSLEYLMEHLADPFPDPGLPGSEGLMAVIAKATAYDPAERYADGRELYDALKAVQVEHRPDARVLGGPEASIAGLSVLGPWRETPSRPARRSWPAVVGAGVLGLVLGAGATGLVLAPDSGATSGNDEPGAASASRSGSPGAGETSDSGATAGSTAPPVGACWGGITLISGQAASAASVPCDEPHSWETYASGILDPATTRPYVEQVAADPVVLATCGKAALKDYLPGKKGAYLTEVIPPDQISWAEGERGFSCVAAEKGAGEVTGSLTGG